MSRKRKPRKARDESRANRLAHIEGAIIETADTIDTIIANQSKLEQEVFVLKARVHYCMERIVVKMVPAPGKILLGNGEPRTATLAQFWSEDGPAYLDKLKEQICALEEAVAKSQAGAAAIAAAVDGELASRDPEAQSPVGGEDYAPV